MNLHKASAKTRESNTKPLGSEKGLFLHCQCSSLVATQKGLTISHLDPFASKLTLIIDYFSQPYRENEMNVVFGHGSAL